MSLYDLIISRRSIRQFQPEIIPGEDLERMINAARLAPSAANLQPLEFVAVQNKKICERIFPCLKWAAYIAPEGDPKIGQEPTAYIIVLLNIEVRDKGFEWDSGAGVENILLTAWEKGIGSCWLISVDKKRLREILNIPGHLKIDSVIALGYPAEKPVVEEYVDSVKYWKEKSSQFHVPKRKLQDILHFNRFK